MDFAVNVESNFATMVLRRFNVWYSVCDGNWNDPNTWMSNALDKKTRISPQIGDDVYINHTVTCNVSATVRNIYVSGTLIMASSSPILIVLGDLQATGTVDQSLGNSSIVFNGSYTSIVNYPSAGSGAVVQYAGKYSKTIPSLPYYHLYLTDNATITLTSALTIGGDLGLFCTLNTQNNTVTVGGKTTVNFTPVQASTGQTGTINSSGTLLLIGQVLAGGGRSINVVGTASIECRGGITGSPGNFDATNSNINFTTNNQNLVCVGSNIIANNVTITGAITVTTDVTSSNAFIIGGVLNGTVAGSTFNNNGWVQFNSSATQMSTGVFNYKNASGASVGYNFNGAYTLPFTTYETLRISGTGTKTVSGNLVLNAKLVISSLGVLDMGAFDLTVTGTTTVSVAGSTLNKTSAGTMIFIGQVICGGGGGIDVSAGNPTVEFRGGIANGAGAFIPGTTGVNFTTNNQSVDLGGGPSTWNCPVTIAAGLTITNTTALGGWVIAGVLNGASSTSIFINNGGLDYKNATAPMVTGKLYCNQATNTFRYSLGGNQDIIVPTDPTSPGYKNLTLMTSGAKRLLGNVSVKGVYTLTAPATLDSNGFSLTNP